MSDPVSAPAAAPAAQPRSFANVAMQGSFVNTLQWFLNKLVTAGAMIVIAKFLDPDEYGVGMQALTMYQFLLILTPLTMGDVLIAHPRKFDALVPTARRLTWLIGGAMSLFILACIPIMVRVYDNFPAVWLGGLLAALAIRPLLEAALVVPVSSLRLALKYRRIAVIDGVVQLFATISSVVISILGGRGASIVAPQVAAVGARALWYRSTHVSAVKGRFHAVFARVLMRAYIPAASAQYIHNLIVGLEIMMLGKFALDPAGQAGFETGLFSFAFGLAAQANTVIAAQLGVVLQPIFGHLQDDPVRQANGFLRAQRVLGAICVPISLLQAIMAEPLFRVAFDQKWQAAVPVFQVISVAQAFYFAQGPSMSCLRAQRRFNLFFWWQGTQMLLSLPLYWYGVKQGGALGVAIASGVVWTVSAPLGVWMCARVAGPGKLLPSLLVFVRPWLVAAPIFAAGYLATRWLAGFRMWGWTSAGDWISIVVVGPLTLVLSVWAAQKMDPEVRELTHSVLGSIRRKIFGAKD